MIEQSKITKVRLLRGVPVAPAHGAFKGEIFERIPTPKDREEPDEFWVMGRDGQPFRLWPNEYEVVKEEKEL